MTRWMLLAAMTLGLAGGARAEAKPFYVGGDVSMLPELERAGATYSDEGRKGDAIELLRARGAEVFRVRVFVKPSTAFNPTWGAVQDLPAMVALGKRIKAAGGQLMVDLHYSDIWADPQHQTTPAEWKDLGIDALEQRVESYTRETLKAFIDAGARPDWVQVGNEIAGGMLWPLGRIVYKGTDEEKAASWDRLGRLLRAGVRGVQAVQGDGPKITTIIHVHGGGEAGVPQWFFDRLAGQRVEFDVIGLSFYPTYSGHLETLTRNINELVARHPQDIMIVETSYPWKPVTDLKDRSAMKWPETEDGQAAFWRDLLAVARAVPGDRCRGVIWWYPEARRAGELHIYRDGAEALVDGDGRLLRAGRELTGTEPKK